MAIPDLAVSSFLEIENIESFAGARNNAGSPLSALREAPLFEESRDSAKSSNIGACGKKFQKFTTGCDLGYALAHDYCAC
jgi:hypothetical protein